MAYKDGVEIVREPKASPEGPRYIWSTRAGEKQRVEIRHCSRQTVNNVSHRTMTESWAPGGLPDPWRAERREKRKRHMRLRKKRGWR